MRPSARRLVPSSEALTPPTARGLPEVTTGGQYFAHMPLHVLLELLSWAQMYSVMPFELVRTEPSFVFPTPIEGPCEVAATAVPASSAVARTATVRVRLNRMSIASDEVVVVEHATPRSEATRTIELRYVVLQGEICVS